MIVVRYVIPGLLIVAGFVCLALAPSSSAVEGFALFTGAGLSVLLLNQLHRIGVLGDSDRAREEEARRYHTEHGHWPDEAASSNGNGTTRAAAGACPRASPRPSPRPLSASGAGAGARPTTTRTRSR